MSLPSLRRAYQIRGEYGGHIPLQANSGLGIPTMKKIDEVDADSFLMGSAIPMAP